MDDGYYGGGRSYRMFRTLKAEIMADWIADEWLANRPPEDRITLWIPDECVNDTTLEKFDNDALLTGGYSFDGYERVECPAVVNLSQYDHDGDLTQHSGAYIYRFRAVDIDQEVEVLVMSSYFVEDIRATMFNSALVCIASVPRSFVATWTAFSTECERLSRGIEPVKRVIVVGGQTYSFEPNVDWDDIILPAKLKADILDDVKAFFDKGIDVYKRLNLKPFRKLLFAGVPGTGKTMLCSALAKWALDRDYLVIYISSADDYGSTFGKIQHALHVAAFSEHPALILLEEIDAYLKEEEKAVVLNVLDGSESAASEKGTLLIATTNYPEAIDDRVLKRPGRLDRIFIIPEIKSDEDAEAMLRLYLGESWRDEHVKIAPKLLGYPGAFVREVAIYALTQLAYREQDELSLDLLQDSFKHLQEYAKAGMEFLERPKIPPENPVQGLLNRYSLDLDDDYEEIL